MNRLSHQQKSTFADSVLNWFDQHGRTELPWQVDKTAYRVWLSEIMLQQTQVATVIPYYHRFLQSFPTIQALADASIDEVLQHWQGLGYYARARNLHRAAQIMRDDYAAEFPLEMEQVLALPGIGRSTAGAILTFAYEQSWPILDGNVKRVLARCFQIEGWYGQAKTMAQLWQTAELLTPKSNTDDYNQAMMDLGAMVCLKSKPACGSCPLTQNCDSFKHNTQTLYPEKKPKKTKPQKQTLMLLHYYQNQVLLYRRPPVGIWGGLWSLPEVESVQQLSDWQRQNLDSTKLAAAVKVDLLKHQFTHFSLDISVAVIELDELPLKVSDGANMAFVDLQQLSSFGLPTPVSKILAMGLVAG
ncbi:MAG: A/G-specific adenine glycosylase [Gammaproteobacteria bacterium]|jgi:A/G-specific adenine glycosylase